MRTTQYLQQSTLPKRILTHWLHNDTPTYVASTCWRLWCADRLRWHGPGVYGPLPPPAEKEEQPCG
jgi:hypothetical protein